VIGVHPIPAFADIEAAAARIAGVVWPTPLIHSPWLSSVTESEVWLKLEIVQATGSYKIRGAANATAVLREQQPNVTTVVTASAGNHGLAIATAAARLGLRARVHLPRHAPRAKREALMRAGAELIEQPTYEDAEAGAMADADATTAEYISPYDHPEVIAGAGTVALEMLRARPEIDTLVIPLGGGGLLSGSALVARHSGQPMRLLGAEAAASAAFTAALAAGRPVAVPVTSTLADGLAGNMDPETRTFALVRDLVDRVTVVSETAIASAMRELAFRERLITEGAGAIAVAALLDSGFDVRNRVVGVVLSGRNVDQDVLEKVLGDGSPTS
jgi:threonine dehydratase